MEWEGRRLQFGSFNQPIGFWIGSGIGALALLSLLVFMSWYCCGFDRPRVIVVPKGEIPATHTPTSMQNDDEGGDRDDGEQEDGAGEDGEEKGGRGAQEDDADDADEADEENALISPGNGTQKGKKRGTTQKGKKQGEDECEVIVTYDHCDVGQHSSLFKEAASKAGLRGWTFSSLGK